jgi:hypothetical protein
MTTQAPELWRGLVGAWTFHEGQGGTLHDVSGYRNHGTLTNMDPASDWVASEQGLALDFDGTDDHVNLGDSVVGQVSALTVFTRFRPDTYASGSLQMLFAKYGSPLANVFYLAMYDDDSDGVAELRGYVKDSSGAVTAQGSFALTAGEWYLAAMTFQAGIGNTVYLDGIEDASDVDGTITALTATAEPALIGARDASGPTALYNGSVDSVWLYNRAFSASEIHQQYNDPYAMFRPRTFQVPVLTQVSGGTTVTASLSEGGSAGDSDSVVATFPRSLTEGAVAGDTRTVTATFRSSVSEGGSAGDTDTNIAALLSTLTEGGTAGDTESVIATLVAALTDGAQAGESWTSTVFQVFSDSVSEGGTAGDTFSASIIAGLVTVALSEGSDAGDTFAATLLAVASLSEGGVAGETITTQWDYKVDTTEGGQAGESLLAVVTYPVQITEGASAGDTWESVVPGLGQLSATLSMAVQLSAEALMDTQIDAKSSTESQLDAILQTQ